jgi:ABC-type transporter Mla MlaB component
MAAPAPTEISFALRGPLRPGDLPGIRARVCRLLRPGVTAAIFDVSAAQVDAVTVDALAQLQLVARRRGCQVRLRGAGQELRELVAFMGLDDVLRIEPRRQPE